MAEEKSEWATRADAFMADYKELVTKHQIDFASYPVFVPVRGAGGKFDIVVQSTPVDISNQPKPEEFVAKEK